MLYRYQVKKIGKKVDPDLKSFKFNQIWLWSSDLFKVPAKKETIDCVKDRGPLKPHKSLRHFKTNKDFFFLQQN